MTTSYPAGLDSYTNPTASDELDDEVGTRTHSEFHADNNDAIEAIQAELGLNPSGASATVLARFDTLDTTVGTKAPAASPTFTDVASFAAGTAAAPSITFTGDTNTGVFQSAADAVGISANGTARVTVGTSAATFTVPAAWTQATGVETRALSIQPYGTGKGPFVLSVIDNTFVATPNPTMYVGYNQTPTGSLIQSGEPALSWGLEADYNDGSGDNKMEMYLQHLSTGSVARRPIFFAFNRDTNALSGMTLMGTVAGGVSLTVDDGSIHGETVAQFIKSNHSFIGFANADNKVTIKGGANVPGILQLGYDGDDNAMSVYPVNLSTGAVGIQTTTVARFYNTPIGAAGASMSVGVDDNEAVGTFAVGSSNGGVKGLVARGKAGQSANLLEIQDSTSAYLSGFTENGYFTTRKAAAPADAELATGELALWFDATAGAAKLKIKAKNASGTVVAGEVALA